VTTENLLIYANLIDAYPVIKLLGNTAIENCVTTGNAWIMRDGATGVFYLSLSGSDSMIASGADKNIYLAPNGTGKVKFGTYVAGIKADSIGYIEVLDAGGTSRRLMVQSA
jgi:hypothetical protein